MPVAADRNLLLGVLALQHGFVGYEQWLHAVRIWSSHRDRSLAEILRNESGLTEQQYQTLTSLLDAQSTGGAAANDATLVPEAGGVMDRDGGGAALQSCFDTKPSNAESVGTFVPTPAGSSPLDTLIPSTDSAAVHNGVSVGNPVIAPLRFKILRPHAQGGLGKVSVARDQELNREVALKEIRFQYADDEAARARFIMEAEVTGGLEHPSIVPVYGLGCFSDGRPYYAMRFIKGHSLKEVVDRFHERASSAKDATGERMVELRGLLQRFIAVCQAIEYAHMRGIIHRDIKPGNIMLGDYGETLVVDWGLAKALGQKDLDPLPHQNPNDPKVQSLIPASGSSVEPTQMGSAIGTLQFMGPEQAAGRVDMIGPPADIYSLGATLYYLLTGRPSVSGQTTGDVLKAIQAGHIVPPRSIARGIPKALDAICMKAMAFKPESRYESAMALARDLERWLADEPVSVCQESKADRLARWFRRNGAWFRAVALSTIAIMIILVVSMVMIHGQRNAADRQRQLAERLAIEKTELAERETELRKKAQWQAASRSFEQSLLRCEQVDPAAGVLSLVENLAEAQAIRADDLESSIRAQLGQWEGALHALESVESRPDTVRGLTLSPDGNTMLVATQSAAMLVTAATGQMIGQPLTHEQRVSSSVFFPDGEQVVTASEDKTIRFWNTHNAEPIGDPIKLEVEAVAIAVSEDQRHLAAASGSTVRLWDVPAREPTEILFEHSTDVTAVEFCHGTELLLVSDWNGDVHVWNVRSKERVGEPWKHGSAILDMAVSPDGELLATSELSQVARLREIRSGKAVGSPLLHQGMVGNVNFSRDGKRLVTGCADQAARVWDVATTELIGSPLRHPSIVNTAVFDASGETVWTGCGDKGLRRWRLATARSTALPLGKNGNVVAASFDPSGQSLQMLASAIVAGDFVMPGERRRWNLSALTAEEPPLTSASWLDAPAFSRDGKQFATDSGHQSIQVWSSATGEPIGKPVELGSTPKAIAFSHDGQWLLVGSDTGKIQLWNLLKNEQAETIQLTERISAVDFFPDGKRILIGSWDQNVRIYRTDDLIAPPVTLPHESLIVAVGVNPAGTQYFTSSVAGGIRLWDATTHTQVGAVMQQASRTTSARFSHQGKTILAGYLDGTVRLWDVRTCDEIGPALRHSKEITALAQSADGRWAATASSDWSARLWNVAPASGSVDEIRRRYQRLTGMEQVSDGTLRVLSIDQWRDRGRNERDSYDGLPAHR